MSEYLELQYHLSMCATSTQSNEDTQVLQRDHRLLLLAQHDRSVHDIFSRTGGLLQSYSLQKQCFLALDVPLNPTHEGPHGWVMGGDTGTNSDCSPWCHPSTLLVLRAILSDPAAS